MLYFSAFLSAMNWREESANGKQSNAMASKSTDLIQSVLLLFSFTRMLVSTLNCLISPSNFSLDGVLLYCVRSGIKFLEKALPVVLWS